MAADAPTSVYEFASDAHRRALGNLGEDRTLDALLAVLHKDPYTDVWDTGTEDDRAALEQVLRDLEADGLCEFDGTWSMTDRGLEALTGPIPNEPPPMNPIVAEILNAEFDAKEQELIVAEKERSIAETRDRLEEIIAAGEAEISEARARAREAHDRHARVTAKLADVAPEPPARAHNPGGIA